MDEDDKKDSDRGDNASTSQHEGDRGSDVKEMSDHDGMEVPFLLVDLGQLVDSLSYHCVQPNCKQ